MDIVKRNRSRLNWGKLVKIQKFNAENLAYGNSAKFSFAQRLSWSKFRIRK